MAVPCTLCGRTPAEGYAFIANERYCHGDVHTYKDTGLSCYEYAGTKVTGLVDAATGKPLTWDLITRHLSPGNRGMKGQP